MQTKVNSMPAKFFVTFLGYLLAVLVIGAVFINTVFDHPVVEFWILLLLPCFGVPILASVALSRIDSDA